MDILYKMRFFIDQDSLLFLESFFSLTTDKGTSIDFIFRAFFIPAKSQQPQRSVAFTSKGFGTDYYWVVF